MDQLVVLIVILLIGAWFSWRDISKGRGWLCRFLSADTAIAEFGRRAGKKSTLVGRCGLHNHLRNHH